jgi:hypothetical protein
MNKHLFLRAWLHTDWDAGLVIGPILCLQDSAYMLMFGPQHNFRTDRRISLYNQ